MARKTATAASGETTARVEKPEDTQRARERRERREAIMKSLPTRNESATANVATPEAMLTQAIQRGLSTESLERLMAMRREIIEERAKAAYFEALSGFQGECPPIAKTREVREKNGDLRYRFASIDSIIEQTKALRFKWGLSHTMATEQAADTVTAVCTVHHALGWKETTKFSVPIDRKAYMTEPQKVASALTFAKRYAIMNGYGIVAGDEDDDGMSASFEVGKDGAEDAVVSRVQEEAPDIGELYSSTEGLLKQLPSMKSAQLLTTAMRLRDGGNAAAMKALYESAKRLVATEEKKGEQA